jgi:hypothetical protein
MSEMTDEIQLPNDLNIIYNLNYNNILPYLSINQKKFIINEWNKFIVKYPEYKLHFFNTIILDISLII